LTGNNKQVETPRASTSASSKTPLLIVAVTNSAAELEIVNGLCHGPLFLLLSPFSYKGQLELARRGNKMMYNTNFRLNNRKEIFQKITVVWAV